VRVILADDAVMVREGLARLLAEHGVEIVARVGTAEDLLRAVDADPPDVAVIDIRMPPTHTNEGLVAAGLIRRDHPQVATMILSQYVEVQYARRIVADADRVGYLLKDRIADVADFIAALRRIAAGGVVVEPALVDELVGAASICDPLGSLTRREREVLVLVAQGKTDRGIATELFVTRKTVEAHVRSILAKLRLPEDPDENRRVHAVLTFLGAPPGVQTGLSPAMVDEIRPS
jgi:DNA-binding NarL/FixJ family response regulator